MSNERPKRLQDIIDNISIGAFGIKPEDAIRKRICVVCKKEVNRMKDELSIKEYLISGLCQECQDKTFK